MSTFLKLKEALISAPITQAPNWEVPFEVMCDASDYALGAILEQRNDNKSYSIYYVSRTLDKAQVTYDITEKEFLAVVFPLEKYRLYLISSKVIVLINHATLKDLLKKSDSSPVLFDGFFFSKSLIRRFMTRPGLTMWLPIICRA